MNDRLNATNNTNLFMAVCAGCLILTAAPLLAADPQTAPSPQVATPKPGDLTISGKLPSPDDNLVMIVRTHANGAQDKMLVQPDANGNFTTTAASLHDTIQTGDKVSAATASTSSAAIPASIVAGPPVVFVFDQTGVAKLGSSWKAGLQVQVNIGSSDTSVPADWKGVHAGTVQTDTTHLQITDSLTPFAAADASTFTVSLVTTNSAADQITVTTPLCDWGRVRCYAYFGGVFSGDFSKKNPYLDFDTEWNWVKGYWRQSKPQQASHGQTLLSGFFDARLTQLPSSVDTQPSASQSSTAQTGGATSTATTTPTASQQASAFASASKSIQIQGGVYWAPYVPDHFIWNYQSNQYGIIPSLLFKGGGRGSLDGVVTQDQLSFPNQDKSFFTYYGGGTRLAFVKWHSAQSESHETMSYVDLTFGKDRLYDFIGATGSGQMGVRHYGMRKMLEGRLKIPKIDVQVGVDLNIGQGQNEVRMVVTTNAISILKSVLGLQ